MASEVWWTGPPGSDDCVQIDITDSEISISQHRAGRISSIRIDRGTGRDMAVYIIDQTKPAD